MIIKISTRDVQSAVPQFLLDRWKQQKEDEVNEQFHPYTDAEAMYGLLMSKMGTEVRQWEVNWNGKWIKRILSIKAEPTLIGEHVLTIRTEDDHELIFHTKHRHIWCFNINSKVKILSIVQCKSGEA